MAKLKLPLLSFRAVGRLTKALSFTRRRKVNILESCPIPSDAKSPNQLFFRRMFLQCRDLWLSLSVTEHIEWETLARRRHMTGYAWFISQCLRPNPGIYLPLAGGTMSGEIEMDGQKIKGVPAPLSSQEPLIKGTPITLTELPALPSGKYWLGNGSNRPTAQPAPVKATYTELEGDITTTALALALGDGEWGLWDISGTLPAGTIAADIHVRKLVATDAIGVRKDGSVLNRSLVVLKNDAFLFPAEITSTRKVSIMSTDVSDEDIFILTGYWS